MDERGPGEFDLELVRLMAKYMDKGDVRNCVVVFSHEKGTNMVSNMLEERQAAMYLLRWVFSLSGEKPACIAHVALGPNGEVVPMGPEGKPN